MDPRNEALVVCGDNMSWGITVRDLETAEELLRIPTCASPPHGFLCVQDHLLVASQLQNHRSFGGGAVFFWALNKPQAPCRSYPMEEIGPIACSRDGVYLVGGAPSGNLYIWEVTSGRMLRCWHAHHRPSICLTFTSDDSLLISASEDGIVYGWSMISLLDITDPPACDVLPTFHISSDHGSLITSLMPLSGHSNPLLISSSLDGVCKLWNLVLGKLEQAYIFSAAVTAVTVDPGEQRLFAGCEDGKIRVTPLSKGLEEDGIVIPGDASGILCEHKGAVTALKFSFAGLWLVSASKDCTACIWDALTGQVIHRISFGKGYITNVLFVPKSSLPMFANQRISPRTSISILDKAPRVNNGVDERTLCLLPAYCSQEDNLVAADFHSCCLMNKQLLDLEQGRTAEAIQLKVETAIENRLWTITMAKHITSINKQLQSRLLGMMQQRLCRDSEAVRHGKKKARTSLTDGRQKEPHK